MTIHPIEQTLAHLATLDEHFRSQLLTGTDTQPGWRSTADLCAEDRTYLNGILAHAAAHYKAEGNQPAVSLWFSHYAFAIMAVAIASYITKQRVPSLDAGQIWARFDEDGDPSTPLHHSGQVVAFAWIGRKFAALPEDPSVGHPDCFIVSSPNLLRGYLRASIIAHLTPLIEALSHCSSLGKPGLWALAADSAASAFTWIGELIGNSALGIEEARAFNAAPSPLQRKRDFIHIEHVGLHYEMPDRTSCCLYFKVEGGQYCSSCPHRPHEERVERIKSWLETRVKEGVAA